ncbi:thiolase-like protein [Xylaria cf. heliscus]|nr:thiolase-like protein [Xylaria cf. heliscus]
MTSLCGAFASSKLNYHYKWSGSSFAVDSPCASSMISVSVASSALIARECDAALARGNAIHDSPNSFSGCIRAGMISKTGGCRTFIMVQTDAIAENDNILGVIMGFTRTYNSTATSITHPSHICQERTYRDVFQQSTLNADEISYVEMRGTGTQADDYKEMKSVLNIIGKKRTKDNPLTVSAMKAVVGYGGAVAGVTSLIKSPSLDKLNVETAIKKMDLRPSSRGDKKLKILLNSFDASRDNSVVVVEEAPPIPAKTNPRAAIERLLEYLTRHPDTTIADLAYSTTPRRMHETLRVAYVGKSTGSIVRPLREDVPNGGVNDARVKVKKTSHVFMFTDSYVFDEDRLIQVTSGFEFQKINKMVLSGVLSTPSLETQRTAVLSQSHLSLLDGVARKLRNHAVANLKSSFHTLDSSSSETPMITPDIGTPLSGQSTPATPPGTANLIDSLLPIVAKESDCSTQDLTDNTLFTDVGIGSLMEITILSIVKREIGLDLEAYFFIANSSVGEAKSSLTGDSESESPTLSSVAIEELKIEFPLLSKPLTVRSHHLSLSWVTMKVDMPYNGGIGCL